MHPAVIQAALKVAGFTQADIAQQCGDVSATLVGNVIHGRNRSKRIENRISLITRIPRASLWPQWYGPDANIRRRKPVSAQALAAAMEQLAALAQAS